REPLDQPGRELCLGQRDSNATEDMESDHSIVEEVCLTLGNGVGPTVSGNDKAGQLLKMRMNEVPCALLGSRFQKDSRFEAAVGFIGRKYKVLLHSAPGDGLVE